MIIIFIFLVLLTLSLDTIDPIWITSNYFRAGNEDVIAVLTTSNQAPQFTFTFSSSLTGVPELGYGVKSYEGKDYFGQERF